MTITMTKVNQELKAGTKTVFKTVKTTTNVIDEKTFNNIVESAPFFRRLGGSESVTRGYTSQGYKVIKIVSKSPCKTEKTIRTFDFK